MEACHSEYMNIQHYKILPTFGVFITKGKLEFKDNGKERLQKFCLSHEGDYVMKIEKLVKRRSNKQNSAFWALPVQLIYEGTYGQWDSEDDVYHFIEDKFSKKKPITIGNELRYITRKLKTLNSTEFGEVYQAVQRWGAEMLLLDIPSPDPEYLAHELKREMDNN